MANNSSISPEIFRMYDIRGIFAKDLTEEVAQAIGKAAGTFYRRNNVDRISVGRDNRISGPQLHKAFLGGVLSTGVHVVDLGVAVTPMVYFSWHDLGLNGAVQITGSHNPPEYNGFKMSLNKQAMYGEQYQEIRKIAESGNFEKGDGKSEEYDIWPHYKKAILDSLKLSKKLKVVIDTGNGTSSLFAPELFRALGCEVIELFTESDGTFPNHPPYPQETEYYTELMRTVKEKGADAGLAFDGDGDRAGVFDEKAEFIENDVLAMLFARDISAKNPGRAMVMNISTSNGVLEDIEEHGGRPILWKTGYPFIVQKMKETSAIFGGEISGHFFFTDRYFGFDDGMYALARFVELLSQSDKPASKLLTDAPQFYSSPELRLEVPEGKNKFEISKAVGDELKQEFPDAEILDFDGVRFNFPDKSWGLVRPSNTEPVIGARVEAKTPARLEEVKAALTAKLAKHGIKAEWE